MEMNDNASSPPESDRLRVGGRNYTVVKARRKGADGGNCSRPIAKSGIVSSKSYLSLVLPVVLLILMKLRGRHSSLNMIRFLPARPLFMEQACCVSIQLFPVDSNIAQNPRPKWVLNIQ